MLEHIIKVKILLIIFFINQNVSCSIHDCCVHYKKSSNGNHVLENKFVWLVSFQGPHDLDLWHKFKGYNLEVMKIIS
jgi:hypothetical protein